MLVRLEAEDSTEAGRRMMQSLIENARHAPRAFAYSSLLVLEGALQQIKAQLGGIDPDILIGTFDDHTMLDLLPNPVLSIRQDEKTLAEKIVGRLVEQPGARIPGFPDVVATELVCRNLSLS